MEDIPTGLLYITCSGSSTEHSVGMGCDQCSGNMGTYDMVEWLEIIWIFVLPMVVMTWLEDWVLVAHGEE